MSYLKANNEIGLIQLQVSLKLSEAVNGISISKIRKDAPEDAAIAIQRLVANLARSFNLSNTINNAQLLEMSLLIMEKYYYLKIEELAYVFKNAKLGQYGKVYNRLDIQIICEWIETYLVSEERISLFEKESQKYKQAEKEKSVMSDKSRERFKKIYESIISEFPEHQKEDENGKYILIRHADYFNHLKELIPEMTEDQLIELRRSFVGVNYRDGMQLIDKALNKNEISNNL